MAEVANEGLDEGVGVARMDLLHSISHHIYRGSKVSMRDIIFGEGEGRAAGAMLDTACVDLSNSVPNYPASTRSHSPAIQVLRWVSCPCGRWRDGRCHPRPGHAAAALRRLVRSAMSCLHVDRNRGEDWVGQRTLD